MHGWVWEHPVDDLLLLQASNDLHGGALRVHGRVVLDHDFVQPALQARDVAGERSLEPRLPCSVAVAQHDMMHAHTNKYTSMYI